METPEAVFAKASKVLKALGFHAIYLVECDDNVFRIHADWRAQRYVLLFNREMRDFEHPTMAECAGYGFFLEAQVRTIMSRVIEGLLYGGLSHD